MKHTANKTLAEVMRFDIPRRDPRRAPRVNDSVTVPYEGARHVARVIAVEGEDLLVRVQGQTMARLLRFGRLDRAIEFRATNPIFG